MNALEDKLLDFCQKMCAALKDLFCLKGKVALVTGGSRGIGRMIAEGFLHQGAKVYITSRKAEACIETVTELSKLGEIRGCFHGVWC